MLLISLICLGSAAILWPHPSQLSHGKLKNASNTNAGAESIGQEMRDSDPNTATPESALATILPVPVSAISDIHISTLAGPIATPVGTLNREAPDAWVLSLPALRGAFTEDSPAGNTQSEPVHADQPIVRWPVAQQRIHAFLRILASLQGMPLDAPPESWTPAARLDMRSTIGPDHTPSRSTLTLDGKSLGGRAAIQVREELPAQSEQTYLTNDQLLRLFSNPSLTQWLDARPFAGLEDGAGGAGGTSDTARSTSTGREKIISLHIQSGPRAMTLSRVGVRWMMTEPHNARAQSEVVSQTIRDLLSLSMENPTPTIQSTATPTQNPNQTTTITLTTQRRTPDANGTVHTQLTHHFLTTIGAADKTGALAIIAKVQPDESQDASFGPIAGTVDARTLLGAVHAASVYLDRITLQATQGDVQAIRIEPDNSTPFAWARTTPDAADYPTDTTTPATRWQPIAPDSIGPNPPTPLKTTQKQDSNSQPPPSPPLDALLTLLTHQQAALCTWVGKDSPTPTSTAPADMQPIATIHCFGLGGLPIGSALLGMAPLPDTNAPPGQPSQSYAVLVRNGVARYYDPRETIGIIRWIVSLNPTHKKDQ